MLQYLYYEYLFDYKVAFLLLNYPRLFHLSLDKGT